MSAALGFDPSPLADEPFDAPRVAMLERVVSMMYTGSAPAKRAADEVLRTLKDQPMAWQRISDSVIRLSQDMQTRHFAVSLIDDAIKTRWKLLSADQKLSLRGYIIQLVLNLAADENQSTLQKPLLTKLNSSLVQIVKNDWPEGWPDFIAEICAASKSSQSLCENNLRILTILSQEVFEFGKDSMTFKKVAKLRGILASQFGSIFELCAFVLSQKGVKPSLLQSALSCLQHFICFVPPKFIFETEIVSIVLGFVDSVSTRIEAIKCMGEVLALKDGSKEYARNYIAFLQRTLERLSAIFPENLTPLISGASRHFWEVSVNQTALLLVNAYRANPELIHKGLNQDAFRFIAISMLRFSGLPNEETLRICLDFWLLLLQRFYSLPVSKGPLILSAPTADPQIAACSEVLADLCRLLISRMAKPPEVTIRELEDGEVVREDEQDTEELALYKIMREVLVYLCNLNNDSMDQTMRKVLTSFVTYTQSKKDEWHSIELNRLCWAIGSVSGAFPEEKEKPFIVEVLRQLLYLCELKKGRESKAIVASNLLYVVGQYPRFLKAHWKFLKTLIVKLFEFLHETLPGVQEMTVNTLLKVADKCRKKFVQLQPGESSPFVEEVIKAFHQQSKDLSEPLHLCTFYEAVGCMISAADPPNQELYVSTLLHSLNQDWQQIIARAQSGGLPVLTELPNLRKISLFLRVNERFCFSAGNSISKQIQSIYPDMLQIYRLYSQTVAESVAVSGPGVMSTEHIKMMRKIKRDCLRLIATFVEKSVKEGRSEQVAMSVATQIIPPLFEPVLGDYAASQPQARDAEVLVLLSAITRHLCSTIVQAIPLVFDKVFFCTLDMLRQDTHSYPDHREAFFELLLEVNRHCFNSLFLLPPEKLSLFVESVLYAMKHQHPKIAEIGSSTLIEFLENINKQDRAVCVSFYRVYYRQLVKEIISVLTDTLHKSAFYSHTRLLGTLVQIVNRSLIDEVVSKMQVMEYLLEILSSAFSTVTKPQLEAFILNLFAKCENPPAFVQVVKDFLIAINEHTGEDNGEEFEDEKRKAIEEMKRVVPGMTTPDVYLIDNGFD